MSGTAAMIGPKFPCDADKKPITRRGFHDARIGVDDTSFPLVGIPTGKVSGFDVLDVDIAGLAWLQSVELPPTRTQVTRSGGRHYFFRHAEGLRCSVSRVAPHVDVRADGGYIIDWSREGYPTEVREIAEWPEWILALAVKAPCKSSMVTVNGGIDGHGDGAAWHGALTDAGQVQSRPQPTVNLRIRCSAILRQVEHSRPGERNKLLNWASWRFGQIVAEGRLRFEIAELLLEGASKSSGLWHDDGPQQCKATIKSGIGAGIRDWNDVMRRRT